MLLSPMATPHGFVDLYRLVAISNLAQDGFSVILNNPSVVSLIDPLVATFDNVGLFLRSS
jgi:hypothetical protein